MAALIVSSDESLIAAYACGDQAAFSELVQRHGDSVLGYLYHMTGNRDQAEDLFQETFKKVHEKGHTFRGEHFKSWLFTIATRTAIDAARKGKRQATISLDQEFDCESQDGHTAGTALLASDAPDPAEEAAREEQKTQVRQAIEDLPVRQRATLLLAYYQQLSYREVARVLGCSVGTVKTQMSRALGTLAHKLPDSVSVTK
ncbi:MAG: sigma-70 family RNA polymerase sigma factor [Sedimentisphaerales bacterium]|nr:sigma-70 family RNA polymerase sigma factor [Sedimentisphaerales bacterium]